MFGIGRAIFFIVDSDIGDPGLYLTVYLDGGPICHVRK